MKTRNGKPSNTETGHAADLATGTEIETRNGKTLIEGRDLHDTTRGGQKVTRRNRITVTTETGMTTYWPNTETGMASAKFLMNQ